jgi:hypothetical protein
MRKLTSLLAYAALAAFTAWFVLYVCAPYLNDLADQIVRHMP